MDDWKSSMPTDTYCGAEVAAGILGLPPNIVEESIAIPDRRVPRPAYFEDGKPVYVRAIVKARADANREETDRVRENLAEKRRLAALGN